MIEVEIKAKLPDAAALEESLIKLGFKKEPSVSEQDIYYNGNDRDYRKTDEALRIRVNKYPETDAQENILTYKGHKLGSDSQTRMELETVFEDAPKMQAILSALGYLPILEVRKLRRMYRQGEITVCIDHVDSLGDYLELEKLVTDKKDYPEAVEELYGWLSKFGIAKDLLTQHSYLELLLRQR